MQHKTDLRDLIEALISLSHNPIALSLCELKKHENGMRIGDFISRYEGLKDGELLGILSSVFGLSLATGRASCRTGVGSGLSDLLGDLYAAFAEPGVKQDLLDYLGVSEIPSPEVFYWRQRLSLLTGPELAIIRALVQLRARGETSARRIEEIAAEARRIDPTVEVTSGKLAALTAKMPIVKDTDRYHLSVEPWQVFEDALLALQAS